MNTRDIRQSILMAADKIERFPGCFSFTKIRIPDSTYGCGCALGWIGYFMGLRGVSIAETSIRMSIEDAEFYRRLTIIQGDVSLKDDWTLSAKSCASTLRCYADKYFPNVATDDNDPSDVQMESAFVKALMERAA